MTARPQLLAMLTEASGQHGREWITFTTPADDLESLRLLARAGWIVARRVRDGEALVAVRVVQDLGAGVGPAERAA